jgi:hypothetical protein
MVPSVVAEEQPVKVPTTLQREAHWDREVVDQGGHATAVHLTSSHNVVV